MPRWAWIACALSFASAPAEAQGVRLDFVRGEGAEDCPERDVLEDRVRARLGSDPFRPPHQLSVEGTVERDGAALVAVLRLRSAEGEPLGTRTIRADAGSCDELTPAIVLAVGLAIDELLATEPPVPPPPPAERALSSPPAREACPAVEPPLTLRGRLALHAPLVIGVLPAPSPGIGLAGGIDAAPFVLDLAAYSFPQSGFVQGDTRYSFTWMAASAAVGLEHRAGWLRISGSVGLELGAIEATAHGRVTLAPGLEPTFAPFLAATARAALGRVVALELGARGSVAVLPRRYLASGTERVIYAQEPVGLLVWAGAVVLLGEAE